MTRKAVVSPKGTITHATCDQTTNEFQPTSTCILNQAEQQGNELNGQGKWEYTNVYVVGQLLAAYDPQGFYCNVPDPLGTKPVQASATGQIETNCTSMPFGDSDPCFTLGQVTSPTEHLFTGKERDAESGLDHFQFRSYASTMGRWMSPDPAGMMAADIEYPQTLNRCAYVNNNPLSFTDSLGLDCAYLNNSGSGLKSFDQHSTSGECGKTGGYWVDGGITDAPSNFPPQPNPCLVAGNAPDTSYYAQRGQAAASNSILDIFNLYHFRRGRFLDAQVGHGADGKPYGGAPSYANYAYGIYMAAAGYTLPQALAGADMAAQLFSRYPVGTPMAGPQYPFNPQVNVANTTKGYNDQTKGILCHKPR